jgi:nitroimidazol reductase NimA-like FMN-containing flavoprotein (pyridoxamine 5'-phosphate oxidase superfamily)
MTQSSPLSLSDVVTESRRFGPIAYVGTTGQDGEPHVAPVVVNWVDERVVAFVLTASRKVRNIRQNPRATVHFSVGDSSGWDSCIVWGSVSIVDDTEGRRGLWNRMGYDLAAFEPGGPEADTHVFLVIDPTRATILRSYGMGGRETWSR